MLSTFVVDIVFLNASIYSKDMYPGAEIMNQGTSIKP